MARAAWVRAGAASCGAREARAQRQGVKGECGACRGGRGRVGSVLVGCVPAGVAPVWARLQGVRPGAGRQDTADCGQGEGPGAKARLGVLLGDSGKLQDMLVYCFATGWASDHGGGACPCHGWLGLGCRVWGCLGIVQNVEGG